MGLMTGREIKWTGGGNGLTSRTISSTIGFPLNRGVAGMTETTG
jgi:hypothetical protein